MRRIALVLMILLALVGCHLPSISPTVSESPSLPAAGKPQAPLTLSGQVSFASGRRVQATMADVASASTVSLIDTGTSQTVATTLTNNSGQFVLTFPNGFMPSSTTTYYLEAVKGLSSNLPGNFAARVRTIVKFQSGWTSITNAIPTAISIDPGTTALAIGAALRNGNPTAFNFTSLIGSLLVGSPDVYTPVTGLSQSDYTAILGQVNQALTNNQDPVAGVALNVSTNTWTQANQLGSSLSVTSFTPSSGTVGTAVTVAGTGFSTTPASNSVKFNGVSSTVTAATATSLTTSAPSGATSGQTTVQVGNLVYMGPTFTIPVVISSFTPASGSVGTSVTITGSGFDATTLTNNAVTVGGASVTVTAATGTSLSFTVPTGAVSGRVVVTVAGSSTTSSSSFTVPVVVSSFTPTSGNVGTSVTISGSGFSGTIASNSVTFNGVAATVTAASATSLTVTAPATGAIAVTVAGQTGTSGSNFSYFTPVLNALYQPVAQSGAMITLEGAFGSSATVNFPGGVSAAATILGANRAKVTVPSGATAGNLSVTSGSTTNTLPFRKTSYTLGLQQFNANYDQACSPAAPASLVTGRYGHTSVVIGNYLYVIGGYSTAGTLNSVERANIYSDGTLGAFSTVGGVTLVTPRVYHSCAMIGNYLYIIGGNQTPVNTLERATINADGTISSFSTVSSTLVTARYIHTCHVIGNYLYVIGGNNASNTYLNSVERATINVDSSLGAFSTVSSTMVTARGGHTSTISGSYLYVIGGSAGAGPYLSSVERATINADGTLGAFSSISSTLVAGRNYSTSAVIGGNLYVIGGLGNTGPLNSIEQATINVDDTLSTFSTASGVTLVTARYAHASTVIGNYLYVVGGYSAGTLNSVERSQINSSGNLSTFSIGSSTLVTARSGHTSAVIGNYLYVIGGQNAGVFTSVERAAINSDGTLSAFSIVSGVTLVTGRLFATSAVIGNYLYVIGGQNPGALNSVERAAINSDGTIGTFSTVSGVTLVTARFVHTSAVIGNYLYVIGGSGGGYLNNMERATINADGTIGTFSTVSGVTLVTARGYHTSAVIGNYLYVIGGYAGANLNSVERATINADGTIGTFSTLSGVTLAVARYFSSNAVVGNSLYVIGGYAGAYLNSVERATINADGTIATFTVSGVTLVTGRYEHSSAVIGNYLYVIGGYGSGSGYLNSVEQATLQ